MFRRLTIFSMLLVVFASGCPEPARHPVTQPADRQRGPTTARPEGRGSSPAVAPPQTQPAPPQTKLSPPAGGQIEVVRPAPPPVVQVEPAKPELPLPPPRRPARPEDSWAIFREAFDEQQDAACTANWTGGTRLEVTTHNVKRLTIDLTLLPEGAPQKGPWNLQIDGQGVELTGFNPKPGYTGRIRDLVRSPNGVWTVDRKALYRIRG